MKTIIAGHNQKILNNKQDINTIQKKQCNCRKKEECPLDGSCQLESIIYIATITTINQTFEYIGSTEKSFKSRYNNHTKSFRDQKYSNETKLSKFIWELKEEEKNYDLKWSILQQSNPYKCGSRKCDLCLSEKYLIMTYSISNSTLLNSRTEMMSKCRHSNKFKIKNY